MRSRYHGGKISGSQQTVVPQIWQKNKNNGETVMFDSLVHDCTKKQNGSPYLFLSFDNANGRLGQEKIVESLKFCYHGNMTSHFSSLLPCCLVA